MRFTRNLCALLCCALILSVAPASAQPQKPDSAKGNAILKQTSQKLAAAKAFSFSTTDVREQVKADGKKRTINVTRDALLRRPNGFWSKYTGDWDWELWYDGKYLTGVSNKDKIFIQHSMPPTLDETMDRMAERLNLHLPISDLLYSNPYDSFMSPQTKGGLVGQEEIEGEPCNHVSYSGEAADWQVWISEKDSLPRRLQITYREEEGKPAFLVTFRNWNLTPQVKDDAFAFKIPDGYERIPILERVRLKEPPATSPQTQTKPSNKQ